MKFRVGTRSTARQVAVVIYIIFGALKAVRTVIANLQPAASGSMTGEKQPTWIDDCWKTDGFQNPSWCPSQEGPAAKVPGVCH